MFIATHSHLFLSRADITSNYVVTKAGPRISLSRVQDISAFHRLQFNLLGNDLESMFIPSAIVIVEGKTDHAYLDRVSQLKFPGRRVTLISANGDIKKKIHGLREAFGDIDKSPFRPRLFVVLDQVHQRGLSDELVRLGVLAENIVIWSRNGIEYCYPPGIMGSIYACGPDQLPSLQVSGDIVSLNGIAKNKNDLATEVIRNLNSDTPLPPELTERYLTPIGRAIE